MPAKANLRTKTNHPGRYISKCSVNSTRRIQVSENLQPPLYNTRIVTFTPKIRKKQEKNEKLPQK